MCKWSCRNGPCRRRIPNEYLRKRILLFWTEKWTQSYSRKKETNMPDQEDESVAVLGAKESPKREPMCLKCFPVGTFFGRPMWK